MTNHRADTGKNEIVVVSIKAFGDLVIAVNCCLRARANFGDRLTILLGEHLVPLYQALGSPFPHRVVRHGSNQMPALFEMRQKGVVAAFRSAFALRHAISAAEIPPRARLLFDQRGIREAYVTSARPFNMVPAAGNIYLAYDSWLGTSTDAQYDNAGKSGPVRIFPGSRMSAKNLGIALIRNISALINAKGLSVELMVLDGERPDLELSGLQHTVVPRQFQAMIDAISGAGAVISADSMPAHIAEFVGRGAFVISPVANRYWLPRTSYLHQWNSVFLEGADSPRLAAFLDDASSTVTQRAE